MSLAPQTFVVRIDNVRLPPGRVHIAGFGCLPDFHSSVHDGNRIPESNSVHHVPRHGAVDATDQYVAVPRRSIGPLVLDRFAYIDDRYPARGAGFPHCRLRDVRLRSPDVPSASVQKAVQVVLLHDIVIYQHHFPDADASQAFRDDAADAAKPDHAYAQALERPLLVFAPTVHRPPLSLAVSSSGGRPCPHDQPASLHDSYLPAPVLRFGRLASRRLPPDSRAPVTVGTYRHTDQGMRRRHRGVADAVALGADVRSAHILPAYARVAVHECQSLPLTDGRSGHPCEVPSVEARIPVQFPFTLGRENYFCDDGGFPAEPAARCPQSRNRGLPAPPPGRSAGANAGRPRDSPPP